MSQAAERLPLLGNLSNLPQAASRRFLRSLCAQSAGRVRLAEPKERILAPVKRPWRQMHALLAFRNGNCEQHTIDCTRNRKPLSGTGELQLVCWLSADHARPVLDSLPPRRP